MQNLLNDKIQDLSRWCETACLHYKNGFYADALTNMRKSGEAACKLMLIYKYNEKIAQSKIGQKSYKELIAAIIKEDIAERRVINWLEALQINGNLATHDNFIAREHAHYSITALRLLVYWIFEEHLKIKIPSSLQKVLAAEEKNPQNNNNELSAELIKLKNEKNEFEKHLQALKGKENSEKIEIEKLNAELQNSVSRIRELELASLRIRVLEDELANSKKKSAEHEQVSDSNRALKPREGINKRAILITVVFVILLTGSLFLFRNSFSNKSAKEISTAPLQKDTFNVMILPLTILQDNPNIKINFEEALEKRIGRKIADKKLDMNITYNSAFSKSSVSEKDAITEGKNKGADLVIFGELYEPLGKDSAEVNLRFTLTRENNRVNGEIGVLAFSRLTDSSAIKIQQRIETVVELALAEKYISKKKFSDALALLHQTQTITLWEKSSVSNFIAECHTALNNVFIPLHTKDTHRYVYMSYKV